MNWLWGGIALLGYFAALAEIRAYKRGVEARMAALEASVRVLATLHSYPTNHAQALEAGDGLHGLRFHEAQLREAVKTIRRLVGMPDY